MTAEDFWERRKAERAVRDDRNRARVRPTGTVRWEPYVKVQWYDGRSLCWRDVQRQFRDESDALLNCPLDAIPDRARWRLMHVSPDGRRPGEPRERTILDAARPGGAGSP